MKTGYLIFYFDQNGNVVHDRVVMDMFEVEQVLNKFPDWLYVEVPVFTG